MCTRQFCGYVLFCVLLMGWTQQVEYRNDQFPRISDVVHDTENGRSQVQYRISNPRGEKTRVATRVRLQPPVDGSDAFVLFSTPVTVVKYDLQPRSTLDIDLAMDNAGAWSEADVRLYVLDDSLRIDEAQLDRLGRVSRDRITVNSLQELFE